MSMLVSTNGSQPSRPTTLVSSIGMLVFVLAAVAAHAMFAGANAAKQIVDSAADSHLNTFVFAAVGALFLLLTLIAHIPVKRAFSGWASDEGVDDASSFAVKQVNPVSALLIPMVIRFAGTFAVLGGLVFVGSVSRFEAGFDVLFWYVSLTTMEVIGIVWASRSMKLAETTIFSPATKGV